MKPSHCCSRGFCRYVLPLVALPSQRSSHLPWSVSFALAGNSCSGITNAPWRELQVLTSIFTGRV